MLMALCLASLLLLAGQTATHSAQPVQSSGATCSVYFKSLNSRHLRHRGLEAVGRVIDSSPDRKLWRGSPRAGKP